MTDLIGSKPNQVPANYLLGEMAYQNKDRVEITGGRISVGGPPTSAPILNFNFQMSRRLDKRLTFSRASTATYVGPNRRIQYAAVDEPRFQYDPIYGGCKGLLDENTATNAIVDSENLSSHNLFEVSITANTAISPDGTGTADLMVETANTGTHRITTGFTGFSHTQTVCASAFVKAPNPRNLSEERYFYIRPEGVGNGVAFAVFDIVNGKVVKVIGSNPGTETDSVDGVYDAGITRYRDGWYRCHLTFDSDDSGVGFGITKTDVLDELESYQGDGTTGLYVWGLQAENNGYPTSYIPTSGTSVTRSSDVLQVPGSMVQTSKREMTYQIRGEFSYNKGDNDTTEPFFIYHYKDSTDFLQISMDNRYGDFGRVTFNSRIQDAAYGQRSFGLDFETLDAEVIYNKPYNIVWSAYTSPGNTLVGNFGESNESYNLCSINGICTGEISRPYLFDPSAGLDMSGYAISLCNDYDGTIASFTVWNESVSGSDAKAMTQSI